jgi:adenosyl cobinamide kinase/adenosyl cobinamide phosphate guanylyltransferase
MENSVAGAEVRITLVTGGARSGKSDYAERLARELGGDDVTFVATATADDAEMAARIARHRAARPAGWHTVEARRDAAAAIRGATTHVVLLDCLTLLASNALLDAASAAAGTPISPADEAGTAPSEHVIESDATARGAVRAEAEALVRAANERDTTLIVVTNEVGLGVVPATRLGRLYRDALGEANRIVAEAADQVVMMVSGIPWRLK